MATSGLVSQGTVISIETGSGGAKNVEDITLGAITKIDSTAHGFSVGDVVAFASIVGTVELNGYSYVITAVETDAFYINVDSQAYTAWDSAGTATPVAFTAIGEVTDWDGPGGQATVIDFTHLGSTAREKKMGLPDEGQLSLSGNLVPADAGQVAALAARAAQTEKGFKIEYSDGTSYDTFDGYVMGFSTSSGVDDKVAFSMTIEITGAVTHTTA
jgi:hypothetical protein